ncbi:MAG: hypothetical protein JNL60_05425 [Bacteroidia bacterium]|nr:hypothetical protein [Bacteroidia bacterium]
MRNVCLVFVLFFFKGFGQSSGSLSIPGSSMLNKLAVGDSIIYYQCHVEEATQQMTTASGQTLTGKAQQYSITEKYVLHKTKQGYHVNYYSSALNVLPNRKFSGLKIRERPYWNFKREKSFDLDEKDLKILLALENKGREAIEYDYVINKYNTNQLIIKQKKDFKQLVIEGDYVVSKLIVH